MHPDSSMQQAPLCACGCGQPVNINKRTKCTWNRFLYNHHTRGAKIIRQRIPLADRFWLKVRKTESCWLWIGAKGEHGYGMITLGGKRGRPATASRVSYEMHYGPIPDGMCVLHRCDTPACVNPAHLFLGTQKDNVTDMIAKGRSPIVEHNHMRYHPELAARGDRHGMRLHPERRARGEQHGMAKLTDEAVWEMRRLYTEGCVTYQDLSCRYGIHRMTVGQIIRRERWGHI